MNRTERALEPAAVVRAVLITLAIVVVAWLVWAGRNVLFVLFFGLLIGVFLSIFTEWLVRAGLPRVPALLLVLLATIGVITAFSVLFLPTVRAQLTTVGQELPQAVEQAGAWIEGQYREITGRVGEPNQDLEEQLRGRVAEQVGMVLTGALPIINTALGAIAGFIVAIVIGIYTAANPGLYRRGFARLIPPPHRPRVSRTLDETGHALRRWIVGTLINMVLVGLLTGIGLWILGVPAVLALAVIAGIFEFIPFVGPWIAAVPGVAVALTVSPTTALWAAALYIVVQQIESNVITPLVMRGAVHLPPALTVLFQALMAVIFGFLGLLLAVPILAVGMVVVRTLYVEPMEAG